MSFVPSRLFILVIVLIQSSKGIEFVSYRIITQLYSHNFYCHSIIEIAVPCQWSAWNLGECSETCGAGTRKNNRTKLVEEEHGGNCKGDPVEIQQCNDQECPGNIEIYSIVVIPAFFVARKSYELNF